MTNLIPMAGAGERFSQEGYKLPKPLIPVSGTPMILKAVNSLPKADKYVFVCRKEHIDDFKIDEILKEKYSDIEVIKIDYLTSGQASTCMLAEDKIDPEDSLLIGACDNGMTWSIEKFNFLIEEDVDAVIWTFRNNVTVKRNPKMYGWVEGDSDNALNVSCKTPISDNPINDHAIVGTFYFKKAKYFFNAVRKMQEKDRKVNNEFYVDVAMNELIEDNFNVKVFEIDKYICWGTPNDLKIYQYWESYFEKIFKKDSGEILKKAVFGMLPKNRLRANMLKRLKFIK